MPTVTVVHILLDGNNDPHSHARRHIGRQMARRLKQSDIVNDAWSHQNNPVTNAITSTSFIAPPFTAIEIYYDPTVTGGAPEQDVIDALIKAGQR
jgi:hypothetical protein